MNLRKTGLVLEGGAMRGLFTAGVLDVMMEHGISYDGAIGVSAGAVFGSNYKSKQIGRAIRYNKRFCGDKRYGSLSSLIRTGDIYETKFCYETIPTKLDIFDAKTYRENPMEFYVTCTDLVTGKPVYHPCMKGDAEDIRWMQASASMPIVSKIIHLDGYELLDGGISDSIPLKKIESMGYNRNVVILTQPLDFKKEKNKLLPIARILLRKYPKVIQAIADRHIRYNETTAYIRKKELRGEVFVIRPPEALHISSTESNPEELERVYQLGRRTAMEVIDDLKAYLA